MAAVEPATIALKWGTLKGWSRIHDARTHELIRAFEETSNGRGAMQENRTAAHNAALIALLRHHAAQGGVIERDWTGKPLTIAEAVDYVTNYDSKF